MRSFRLRPPVAEFVREPGATAQGSEKPAGGDCHGKDEQDHGGHRQRGPAGIAERRRRRPDWRWSAGRRQVDLSRLTHRSRRRPRLRRGGPPRGPRARRARRGRADDVAGAAPMAEDRRARCRVRTVVFRPPRRDGEGLPGVVDVPHPFGVASPVDVWMEALGESSVRARDLERARVSRHSQNGVGVERPAGCHRADSTAGGSAGPSGIGLS